MLLLNKINFSNTKIIFIFIILIRILLDFVYLQYVQPSYAYWGYTANPTSQSYLTSYVVLIPSIFLLKSFFKDEKMVVSNMVILLYLIGFVPTTSIIACDPQPIGFVVSTTLYWYLFLIFSKSVKVRDFRLNHMPESTIYLIGVFFSLVVVYVSGAYAHFRFNISLENVYDLRVEARAFKMSKMMVYLWSASRMVLPLITSLCFMKKRYVYGAFFTFIILLNFSIDGMKSTLFSLIICLLLFFFVKNDFKSKYPPLIVVMILLALLEYKYLGISSISDMFLRRNFFLPAIMDTKYYDMTIENGPLFWSNVVGGTDVAFYVGDFYFHSDGMRANNGLFSDAFMNLSFVGCIIYPLIYAYLFKFSERMLKDTNRGVILLMCFLWAYKMRGTTVTTVLLTHGIAVALIVLALMPATLNSEQNNSK